MIASNTETLPSAQDLSAATGKPLRISAAWLARLAEIENHVAAHGRLPRVHGGGRDEGRLYDWLQYQRETPAHEECRAILDTRVPGWRGRGRNRHGTFESRVQDLKIHRDAYGAWPSSRARDESVVALSKWLDRHRIMLRSGGLVPYRKSVLDQQVPGWDESVQETWERTVREIATFRSLNGRLPAYSSKEHSERRLSRWLGDYRRGRNLTPERKAYLDEHLPGWTLDGRLKSSRTAHRAA